MQLALTLVLIAFASVAAAQSTAPQNAADRAVTAWNGWMKKHRIKAGAIAVSYQGKILAEDGIKRTADDPAPVASLSKAITAVCALEALGAKGLTADATVAEAMPTALSAAGGTGNSVKDATVTQLITHSSGLTTRYHSKEFQKLRTLKKENKEWQFGKILAAGIEGRVGNYHYSNSNYTILGLMIEELTGRDYVDYCTETVLSPHGITTADMYSTWAVMTSFGGWEISAKDYTRFTNAYFDNSQIVGTPIPDNKVRAVLPRGRSYGPGLLYRVTPEGANFWHVGSWKWRGRIRSDFGAYILILDNGLTISVNHAHAAIDGEIPDLERALWDATRF